MSVKKIKHPVLALFKQAVLFSILTLIILSVTRLAIVNFVVGTSNIDPNELPLLFLTGFRFDLKVVGGVLLGLMCLPALVAACFDGWKIFIHYLRAVLLVSIILMLFLSFLDFGFYLYFGAAIDSLVFGFIEDGTTEVMSSVLGDSRLVGIIVACTVATWLFSYGFIKITPVPRFSVFTYGARIKHAMLLLLVAVLMVLPARGSLDTFPLSRKSVSISDNALTNSLMFNAPYHLYYALKDRKRDGFAKLNSQAMLQKYGFSNVNELIKAAGFSAKNGVKQLSASKPNNFKKLHVIFVLMESWSSHIALMDSKNNNVLGEFSKHAQADYFNPYFFSNGYGTNETIDSLLLNSPITPLSQSAAAKVSFDLSNVWPFKQQGYRTLFLSGGSSSWRNHNNFWPQQGFDRYLGRATIEAHYGVKSDNPWGVYEEYLFGYMKKMLMEASKSNKPLFSFMLTTNNHPPIRLPANYVAPKFIMEKFGYTDADKAKHEILTGFHYQSNALGEFITWLKNSPLKDDVIVVATGDHIYKGFVNYASADMAFLKYAVPAYFYLPERYKQLAAVDENIIASHQDLFPTLYELALSNAQYAAFGTPLMDKNPSAAYGWVNRGEYLFDQGVIAGQKLFKWKDKSRILLNEQAVEPTAVQKTMIEQQKNQMALKRYWLVKEYEQKRGH